MLVVKRDAEPLMPLNLMVKGSSQAIHTGELACSMMMEGFDQKG